MRFGFTTIAVGLVLAIMSVTAAAAQDDAALLRDAVFSQSRNVAVTEREKPEYQPIPVQVGALVLTPAITTGAIYDDNIYANNAAKTADLIWQVRPEVSLKSDWGRNQIAAFARVDQSAYTDHPSQDTTDVAVGMSGRLDIHHDLGAAAGASFELDTLSRTSEASPTDAARPIRYTLSDVFLEAAKAFDRLRLTAKAAFDNYSFDNGAASNGVQIYERDQDHTETSEAFRAEYAYRPNLSAIASLGVNQRDYRNALPGEASRTSRGYEITVAPKFDLTQLVRGEIAVGYLAQTYGDRALKTVRGLALRGKVEYFLSPITTVTLSGGRRVQDSGIPNVGGYLANTAALQLDHELRRNLVLSTGVNSGQDDYGLYRRIDRRLTGRLGAVYLMNRAMSLAFAYVHAGLTSAGLNRGVRFDINRLTIGLTLRA